MGKVNERKLLMTKISENFTVRQQSYERYTYDEQKISLFQRTFQSSILFLGGRGLGAWLSLFFEELSRDYAPDEN